MKAIAVREPLCHVCGDGGFFNLARLMEWLDGLANELLCLKCSAWAAKERRRLFRVLHLERRREMKASLLVGKKARIRRAFREMQVLEVIE